MKTGFTAAVSQCVVIRIFLSFNPAKFKRVSIRQIMNPEWDAWSFAEKISKKSDYSEDICHSI